MLKAFNRSRSSRITHGCLKPNAELVLCHGHFIKNQVIHLHYWNNFPIYQLPTKNTNICKFTNGFSMLKWYFFFGRLQCYANLKSYIFLFFGNSSVFHLNLGFVGLISGLANRRDRPFCYLFSSRQGLHDLLDLKMLGAYMQIHRIKLFISARTKTIFFVIRFF